ncbi:hypothetical protein CDL12_21517 [Handroanthus impetiginosus]|uniref:NAC domain-containing protein n=1 Tax=Handroanthus impetiginosus TaxID=429701 RepID=A0A2G9GKX9_9LAMI|nr:hypothetical protein CDL12_21517 [Handroanthus impetiginosus]
MAEDNPAAAFLADLSLGYRFAPTDLEVIRDYLMKKIKNEPLPAPLVHDVNLYQYNPETLVESYPEHIYGWYFFTPRERKYKNGSRPNRAAGTGYWKASGKEEPILAGRSVIGHKRTLAFYQGNHPNGDRTEWMMQEFTIAGPQPLRRDENDMRLDDWVLCRIYKSHIKARENKKRKR